MVFPLQAEFFVALAMGEGLCVSRFGSAGSRLAGSYRMLRAFVPIDTCPRDI